MKNAIIVSKDAHWRTVMEGILLGRGWQVTAIEELSGTDGIDPSNIDAIIVDASSVDNASVSSWMDSVGNKQSIQLVMAPDLAHAEVLASHVEDAEIHEDLKSKHVLRFWGVRGSIPTPGPDTAFYGGNTSCVELFVDGERIILDAGSGIRVLGMQLMKEAAATKKPLEMTLIISHTHWDHIQGLPFFIPAYVPTNKLHVVGYKAVCHHLEEVLGMQMEPTYFPVSMEDMPSHPDVHEVDDHFDVGPVKVAAFFTNHPGRCAGFRFETSVGSIAYVSDNEINHEGQATHLPKETAEHMIQRMVDTLHGVRVLIHDAQYTAEEYRSKVGWGHSAVEDVVDLAGKAGVERLFLFHHDPMRSDADINRVLRAARARAEENGWHLRIDAAREGLEVHL